MYLSMEDLTDGEIILWRTKRLVYVCRRRNRSFREEENLAASRRRKGS